jgi:CheY-like chemotaxis protein
MSDATVNVRIVVATDNGDDAHQVVRQLKTVFSDVRASVVADDARATAAEVETLRPQVLVLAFDTLEKAQRYYLGLYRHGSNALQAPHRTVVLCGKDEAREAFELCLKNCFDDYVLYWPLSYDGGRLAMSVWVACRQMAPEPDQPLSRLDWQRHARHLEDIEGTIAKSADVTAVDLRTRIAPSLAGTRPLADAVRRLRPVVMVVDDDEFSCRLVQQALDPARWQAVYATDGASALSSLRRTRPDLILMDVRLPDTDGVSLTRRLKATTHLAAIPIVMMTGDARRETLLSSMEAGAAGFVVKPVRRDALDEKLSTLLGCLRA